MNALKYSRLPTSDPGPEFSALDGPSYFSYEIERKKYGSAFNYTGTAVDTETIHPVGKLIGVTFVQYDTTVQLSTYADNVALPAFACRTLLLLSEGRAAIGQCRLPAETTAAKVQGLCNGRASIRSSVCPINRHLSLAAA